MYAGERRCVLRGALEKDEARPQGRMTSVSAGRCGDAFFAGGRLIVVGAQGQPGLTLNLILPRRHSGDFFELADEVVDAGVAAFLRGGADRDRKSVV